MIVHVILGLLLLGFPIGMLYVFERKMLSRFGVAVVRMSVQLLAACLMVWVLYRLDRWWVSVAWLLAASLYSAIVASWKTGLQPRRLCLPLAAGLFAGTLLVGLYLLYAVLPLARAMNPHWFVPLTALLLGHAMTMAVKGIHAYCQALRTDEQQYEFLRGNGYKHLEAVRPFVRQAFLALAVNTIANLQAMAFYSMPLLLCGILLGGAAPINAFVVTLLLVVGAVAASVLSLAVSLWLADRQLFDSYGKLRQKG